MTKLLILFLFTPILISPCMAAITFSTTKTSDGLNSLRNEISKLESELAQKTEKLNKCAQKNKNFQIAGIAAVGLTGAGVAANISTNKTNKNLLNKISKTEQEIATTEQKIDDIYTKGEILAEKLDAQMEQLANIDQEKFIANINEQLTDAEKKHIENALDKIENALDKKIKQDNPTATPEEIKQIKNKLSSDEIGNIIADSYDLDSEQDIKTLQKMFKIMRDSQKTE